MDENIQKLQQIGIKEISKQTRISSSRLKNIFEYNFANFKRVHLVGFLQILEREYKMDLSSVLEAYDRFGENDGMQVPYDEDLQDDFYQAKSTAKHTKNQEAQEHTPSHSTQQEPKKAQEQITSFDFGVIDTDNEPKQKTPKEIPHIDLRLDIDEPKKESQVDTANIKESKSKDENPAKILQKSKEPKSPKEKKSIQIHNETSFDTQKRRYDSIDTRKKEAISKQRFYLTIVCTIIAVLIYLIYQNLSAQKQINQADNDLIIPEETDRSYETQSIEQNPQNGQSQASEQALENTQDTQDEEATKETQEGSTDVQALDSTQASATNQNLQSLQPTQPAPQIAGKMVLKAETMLWFDIVDLDTNRRKYQGVTSDTYSIDKDDNHRWLLAFGHSNFSLSMNGASVDVPRLDVPLYFIYEPASGFKRVDNVTYKRLSDQAR
ncbi:hypothetical protein [Helicobacter macacae]|uniref:Uncharacterized protein n=1 Tax=Helicobacter macacae MIT 99-5501 TaxID=1357400 RepID=V8C816_9HELI|nr:hypothetical protein [Helicobacter macacae]ETD23484.1 hypothetical protein HMPREF2086_01289 [Helicobacter macacae MIT 99-5501]